MNSIEYVDVKCSQAPEWKQNTLIKMYEKDHLDLLLQWVQSEWRWEFWESLWGTTCPLHVHWVRLFEYSERESVVKKYDIRL